MNQKIKSAPHGEKRQSVPDIVYATKGTFSGEINLQWDAVDGALSYVLQMSKGKQDKWAQVDIIYEPYYMLSGLDNKIEYFFRVAAVFKNGQSGWSEILAKKL